jgi:hypothetical protein
VVRRTGFSNRLGLADRLGFANRLGLANRFGVRVVLADSQEDRSVIFPSVGS